MHFVYTLYHFNAESKALDAFDKGVTRTNPIFAAMNPIASNDDGEIDNASLGDGDDYLGVGDLDSPDGA